MIIRILAGIFVVLTVIYLLVTMEGAAERLTVTMEEAP